ncbi:hypothetical protein ACQZ6F_14540 [Rhizobium sp. A22-96]
MSFGYRLLPNLGKNVREGEKALASINEWPYQGRTGEVAEWSKALPC